MTAQDLYTPSEIVNTKRAIQYVVDQIALAQYEVSELNWLLFHTTSQDMLTGAFLHRVRDAAIKLDVWENKLAYHKWWDAAFFNGEIQ
jgi:hypothetical protein